MLRNLLVCLPLRLNMARGATQKKPPLLMTAILARLIASLSVLYLQQLPPNYPENQSGVTGEVKLAGVMDERDNR